MAIRELQVNRFAVVFIIKEGITNVSSSELLAIGYGEMQ